MVARGFVILGDRTIEPHDAEQLFSFIDSPLPMGKYLLEVVSQKGAKLVRAFRVADYIGMSTIISVNVGNDKDNNITITSSYAIHVA